jgi:integrase
LLTSKKVERTKAAGRYRDGTVPGLLLQISKSGAKSFVLRYELRGREHMLGLGSAKVLSLKDARERARAARRLLLDGIDPVMQKHVAKAAAKAAEAKRINFRKAAEQYFELHQAEWKNAEHRDQFLSSLEMYAFEVIGDLPIDAIDTPNVMAVVQPIWLTKTTTASRVRNRIEQIIDYSVVSGARPAGFNPARWKGHLDQLLPKPRKVAPIKHHAAMDYVELPAFMAALRERENSIAGRALEFLILTAARSNEVLGAKWDEIDFDTATWTVPAERMKARREHRVPLSPQAIKLLRDLPVEDGNPHIFVGPIAGGGLSYMAFYRVLDRLQQATTTHGFRATFRTWAAEQTNFAREIAEASLAHTIGNAVERSYARTTLFDRRRKLMEAWSKFVTTPPVANKAAATVTPIRRTK